MRLFLVKTTQGRDLKVLAANVTEALDKARPHLQEGEDFESVAPAGDAGDLIV